MIPILFTLSPLRAPSRWQNDDGQEAACI
jgi:hypothetical protein